ncbi:MAG: methyl-accepting chemotaxis protein [Betaproteobacteria bacterium]|nr:methyl-accepting chemotaxis protein [Betaproteobacteria bacterium]
MFNLRRFKVRSQLVFLLSVVFLLFLVSAFVSYQALNRAKTEFNNFIAQDQKLLLNYTELYANGLQMGQALRNIILDPANTKAYENFDKASKEMDTLLTDTRELLREDAAQAEAVSAIASLRTKQQAFQASIQSQLKSGNSEEAKAQLIRDETPTWREIRKLILERIQHQKEAIEAREKAMQASTTRAQYITLALSVLAVVIGLAIASAIVANILSQINLLGTSLEALAQGEGDLTARLDVSGNNELCRVSGAFNTFVGNLQSMVRGVKDNASQLHELSGNLAQASSSLRAVSTEQANAMTSTAAAVDEMTSSIGSVADGAERVKEVSAQSADYSDQGLNMMGQLTGAMSGVQQAVHDMAGSVGQFLHNTQSIIGATQHVKDIAEQINLLALNAAIEAARAGEQGRGFAVVADEVRKLAEKTAQYANEINKVTAELEANSSHVEATIRKGETALEDSSKRSAEVSAIVERAHSAVLGARQGVEEITASVKEQSQASGSIAQNLNRVADFAVRTEHAVEESDRTVRQLRDLADTLHNTVSRFRS